MANPRPCAKDNSLDWHPCGVPTPLLCGLARRAGAVLGTVFALGACGSGPPTVLVLVEDRLASPLQHSIEQFRSDLESEGVAALVDDRFAASSSPAQIRTVLRETHDANDNLVGAILVGEFGAALFNLPRYSGDPYLHDHLSDLYYMDIDGYWEDGDSDGIYDTHRSYRGSTVDFVHSVLGRLPFVDFDRRSPDIWVSRLRAVPLGSLGGEVELLRQYFAKNHAYRTGQSPRPARTAFVVAAGVNVLESEWGSRPHELYDDVAVVQCQDNSSDALREFLKSPDGFELGIINTFSGPRIHHFDYHEGGGFDQFWFRWAEGRRRITEYSDELHLPTDIGWAEIATLRPKVLFYHLLTSEVGRHDHNDYLAGTYVFAGDGLAAIAGTQHSGAVGNPQLYRDLASGMTIGDAWRRALEYEFRHIGEEMIVLWCDGPANESYGVAPYKAVLIGDGSLRLPS